jgi:hypothetical protein
LRRSTKQAGARTQISEVNCAFSAITFRFRFTERSLAPGVSPLSWPVVGVRLAGTCAIDSNAQKRRSSMMALIVNRVDRGGAGDDRGIAARGRADSRGRMLRRVIGSGDLARFSSRRRAGAGDAGRDLDRPTVVASRVSNTVQTSAVNGGKLCSTMLSTKPRSVTWPS